MIIFAFSIQQLGWGILAVFGILVGFGALVLVHEFGHFIIAKMVGIKVEAFAFGFGPKIIGRKRGETEYRINWIPFGGYVKLAGMEGAEGKKPQEIEGGFYAVKPFRRSLAIAAGAFFNFLLALFIFTILWFTGRSVPEYMMSTTVGSFVEEKDEATNELKVGDRILSINGRKVKNWEDIFNTVIFAYTDTFNLRIIRDGIERDATVKSKEDEKSGARLLGILPAVQVVVEDVKKDSIAEKIGLKKDDLIQTAAGNPVGHIKDFKNILKNNINREIELGVVRNGEKILLKAIVPVPAEESEYPVLGFISSMSGPFVKIYENPITSIKRTGSTVYWSLRKLLAIGSKYRVKPKAVSGPVGIMTIIYRSIFQSFSTYVWLIGFLSLNLCILNLLPVPILDGGHILFAAIEGIRRKPVNEKVIAWATNVFFVLIVAFFLYVTANDFKRILSPYFDKSEEKNHIKEEEKEKSLKEKNIEEPKDIPTIAPAN